MVNLPLLKLKYQYGKDCPQKTPKNEEIEKGK